MEETNRSCGYPGCGAPVLPARRRCDAHAHAVAPGDGPASRGARLGPPPPECEAEGCDGEPRRRRRVRGVPLWLCTAHVGRLQRHGTLDAEQAGPTAAPCRWPGCAAPRVRHPGGQLSPRCAEHRAVRRDSAAREHDARPDGRPACSVPGCVRSARRRDRLCNAHRYRLSTRGDVLAEVPVGRIPRPSGLTCEWEGCQAAARPRPNGGSSQRCAEHAGRHGPRSTCAWQGCEAPPAPRRDGRGPGRRCEAHHGLRAPLPARECAA